MTIKAAFLLTLLVGATVAEAQLPRPEAACAHAATAGAVGIDAQRAEFAAQSGGTTVYFGSDSAIIGAPAKATLGAQAAWLRRHPEVAVRIEGYGDRARHARPCARRRRSPGGGSAVLSGVTWRARAQVSTTSWGKERPGLGRAVTILVR